MLPFFVLYGETILYKLSWFYRYAPYATVFLIVTDLGVREPEPELARNWMFTFTSTDRAASPKCVIISYFLNSGHRISEKLCALCIKKVYHVNTARHWSLFQPIVLALNLFLLRSGLRSRLRKNGRNEDHAAMFWQTRIFICKFLKGMVKWKSNILYY